MSQAITDASRVSLHFSLALPDGQLIDSTFERKPATLNMGDGSLLPGFEKHLLGMCAGQKKTVEILPEQAFGQHNPDNIQQFERGLFSPDQPLEPGLVVSFADANRQELPGVVSAVDGDRVSVDFNHPLAGRTIVFTVQIESVSSQQGE